MNKEQQINEIANIIIEDCGDCDKCDFRDDCLAIINANKIYNAGFRKGDEENE